MVEIKRIFKERWEMFLKTTIGSYLPEFTKREVKRMLACRDPHQLGYHKYHCPLHPDQFVVVPHTCKSRFCNSCGKLIADKWVFRTMSLLPKCSYFHITFTISDKLRPYFIVKPELNDLLFRTARDVVISWFGERGIIPAVITAFHSHGRDAKHHPHLHMVVSCGGLNVKTSNTWLVQEFIPFKMLRKRWQAKLLFALDKTDLPEIMLKELRRKNWYVNVSGERMSVKATLHYLGRYAQKPIVAQSRITDYDGEFVTFVYHDFKSQSEIKWTLPVFKFMSLLVQHIQKPGFRMIRYYGLLSNRGRAKWLACLKQYYAKAQVKEPSWRERQIKLRGKDPLLCPKCSEEMILCEFAFAGPLGEMIVMPV